MRRRCGPYFDITEPRHLAWLVATSTVCSLLRLVGNFTVTYAISHHGWLSPAEIITWAPAVIFGAFVLALPLLAITSRGAVAEARPDGWALLLLAVLAGEVVLTFGPVAFPVAFIVMPVMMLLGWRYGLLGAGVGALVTVVIAAGLSSAGYGIIALLRIADAQALETAGAFAIVLELIPPELAQRITQSVKIPTIGIGAGPHCSGQVQVFHDVFGLYEDFVPKHAKRFGHLGDAMRDAAGQYLEEVRSGKFPA